MAGNGRIPIPLSQRLRRARYQVAPLLAFALAVAGTIYLWGRQAGMPNATGSVEAVRHDVASHMDGRLVRDDSLQFHLYDHVRAGDLLGRLDDRPLRASLAALKADLEQFRRQIAATEAELRLNADERAGDREMDGRRLAIEIEQMSFDLLDRRVDLEADRIELLRRNEQVELSRRLRAQSATTELDHAQVVGERDVVAERVKQREQAIAEATKQLDATRTRMAKLPAAAQADVEAFVGPMREAITAQQHRIREIETQIDALRIEAPASGVIVAIHRRPGQAVRAGDPIITIAEEHSTRIVAYLRTDQRLEPHVDMPVGVKRRTDPGRVHESRVEMIGPQVELIPPDQLRNPTVPEWGLPVSIALPADVELRPGEVVDLVFKR